MPRKAFVVNDAMREKALSLARVGTTQDDIAEIIGCDPKTLRKYFPDELQRGMAEANAEIGGCLFANAKAGNVVAQIFYLKTRARWRERGSPEESTSGGDGGATARAVVILPDNGRDPQLTEELRKTQEKYFARKHRRQSR
jgi:hypothetical protein